MLQGKSLIGQLIKKGDFPIAEKIARQKTRSLSLPQFLPNLHVIPPGIVIIIRETNQGVSFSADFQHNFIA